MSSAAFFLPVGYVNQRVDPSNSPSKGRIGIREWRVDPSNSPSKGRIGIRE